MKKAVILFGSPHKNGNTSLLAKACHNGLLSQGVSSEIIYLSEKNINYCQGCQYCRNHNGECIQNDDMTEIMDKIIAADIVVFATPLYLLTFSAQLKTCVDRFYNAFHAKKLASPKKSALLVTSGAPAKAVADVAYATYQAILNLLGWEDCGYVWAGGHASTETLEKDTAINEAYTLGENL